MLKEAREALRIELWWWMQIFIYKKQTAMFF
jgi:hypothetical protein